MTMLWLRCICAYLSGERGGNSLVDNVALSICEYSFGWCLSGPEWSERQLPIIAYLLTRAEWKRRGIGRQVLSSALKVLSEKGFSEVRAVITEGNEPSEKLFRQLGFQKIEACSNTA